MNAPEPILRLANQLGKPGQLLWLRVDKLDADPAYQREVNTKRGRQVSAKIAQNFEWKKFGVLHVAPGASEGEDRRYWVLDGLHRLEGARAHGGIEWVPCWVDEALSVADRAEIFLAVNRDRVAMHPYAIHRALISAGDPAASVVESVCKLTGVSVPLYPVPRNMLKPGQTLALATLKQVITRYGQKAAIHALRAMAEAWKDKAGEIRALSIKAVTRLVACYEPISDEKLIASLRSTPMDQREALMRGAQVVANQAPDVLLASILGKEIGAELVRSGVTPKAQKPKQVKLRKKRDERMERRSPAHPSTEGGQKPARRMPHAEFDPANVRALAPNDPAIVEKRTMFPNTVVDASESPRLLVSGVNQRKLGDRVTKGEWAGMPLFALTLEERKTCPKSCHMYASCYGNNMHMARRHKVNDAFFEKLWDELTDLQALNPKGFVVRLHVLGDFPSVEYVWRWKHYLTQFSALHVFGYTAWHPTTNIGFAIEKLRNEQWNRFAIRFSRKESYPGGATTITRRARGRIEEGLVCPAQTEENTCCGSCGLCWSAAAKDDTIVFMMHGRRAAKTEQVQQSSDKNGIKTDLNPPAPIRPVAVPPAPAPVTAPVAERIALSDAEMQRKPGGVTIDELEAKILAAVDRLGKKANNGSVASELDIPMSRITPTINRLITERKLRWIEGSGYKTRYMTRVGSIHDPDRVNANDLDLNEAITICKRDDDHIVMLPNKREWRVNGRETLDRAGLIARGQRIAEKRRILGKSA